MRKRRQTTGVFVGDAVKGIGGVRQNVFVSVQSRISLTPALSRWRGNWWAICGGKRDYFTSLAFLFISIFLLSACQTQDDSIIRFGMTAAPSSLDPRFATDAESTRLNRLIYQPLVDFQPDLTPKPALADWRRLSPTHYRFTLQTPRKPFHDGTSLTAEDVAATYRFILAKPNASPHRGSLSLIEAIQVIDDNTVDFILNKADPMFPGYLVVGIVPRSAERRIEQPVGNGAFRFIDWPEEGRVELQRVSDNQVFEFIAVKEPLVRVLKLLRGELDMIQNGLPPELIAWLNKRDDVNISTAEGSNFSYLGFNLKDPLTGQLKVRQAVAYAIDREALIRYMLGNAAQPAGALLPPTHWAGNPELHGYDYQPDKAKALLTQLPPLQLTYKTSSNPFRVRLATVLKDQLEQVGIAVDLRTYDWGTFYSDIKNGRFQMYTLSWVGIKTPDIFQYVFHSDFIPPKGANRGLFTDPHADALIEQAMQSEDLKRQAELYRQLQAYVLEKLPYVPLWYEDHVIVTRPGISGYTLASDGNYDSLSHVQKGQ
jgi:peptide/nickel transport system substrate-binding protein